MNLIIEDHFKANLQNRLQIDFTDFFEIKLVEILTDIEYDKIITKHNKKLYIETFIGTQRVVLIFRIHNNKTYRLITIIPAREHDAIKKMNKKHESNNHGRMIFNLNKRINELREKNKALWSVIKKLNDKLKTIKRLPFTKRLLYLLTGKINSKTIDKE